MQDTTILILDPFGNDYMECYNSIRALYPEIKIIAINPSDLQDVKDEQLNIVIIDGDFTTRKAAAISLINTQYAVVMDSCSHINTESNIELLVDRVRKDYDICGGQISFDGRVEFLYGAIHMDESIRISKEAGTDLVHFFYAIRSDLLKAYKPNSGFYFFEDHLDDCITWKRVKAKVGFEIKCTLLHKEIDKNLLRYNFKPMFRAFEAKHNTKYAPVWPLISSKPLSPEKSLRVGFIVVSYMSHGGTETFHRSLLPHLKSIVNIVGFVATEFYGGDGSKLEVPYEMGVEAAKKLAADCDVVITWGIYNLATILPTHKRTRVIAVHHADLSSDWSNNLILSQNDLFDKVICVNPDVGANLLSKKPIHYIPNSINLDRITCSGKQLELKVTHNIPPQSKIVLFGHRLSAEKRPLLAIEIIRQLPDDWIMVIAGGGAEQESVEAAAIGCDRVRIVGVCDSLADWLAISNCFLSLSTYEGFGLSICEAMAAGIPVVSTPTGIAPGLATTLPIDSKPTEWANAIINSRVVTPAEIILEKFSADRMIDAWRKVILQEVQNG